METIATSKIDAARIAAAPLMDPFVSSMDGSNCNVTKAEIQGNCKD